MSIVEQASEIGMTEEQVNAIMGSLLGDASLRKSGEKTQAIRWNHGQVQEDYVIHKYEVLQEFATRPPFVTENPGYGDFWIVLTLKALPIFYSMYTLLRPQGSERKTVTVEYLNEITHPIALAWWFMDDGSRDKNNNCGSISTNGFSEEEVNLLCLWLRARWGVDAKPMMVKHSSTRNIGYVIRLNRDAFLALMNLISPFVPECMEYKIKVKTRICQHCGKEFTVHNQSGFCSRECREIYQSEHKHEWYLKYREEHLEEMLARGAAYREEHREELRKRGREYRENMTQEQKEHRAAQMAAWQQANREHINEVRRAYRKRMKGDPEYEAKLKAERNAYYKRKAADPERHAHMLELERKNRQRPEVKARELAYQRKRRALKIINDPAEAAKRYAWKHRRGPLLALKDDPEAQQKLIEQYAAEHPEYHLEEIKADPTAWELYQQMQNGSEISSSIQS